LLFSSLIITAPQIVIAACRPRTAEAFLTPDLTPLYVRRDAQ